jgi:hypothetical protein
MPTLPKSVIANERLLQVQALDHPIDAIRSPPCSECGYHHRSPIIGCSTISRQHEPPTQRPHQRRYARKRPFVAVTQEVTSVCPVPTDAIARSEQNKRFAWLLLNETHTSLATCSLPHHQLGGLLLDRFEGQHKYSRHFTRIYTHPVAALLQSEILAEKKDLRPERWKERNESKAAQVVQSSTHLMIGSSHER